MKRLFEDTLVAWKASRFRKPLIVRGARQVGKTFTISTFGKECFASFIRIDFEKDPLALTIFNGSLAPADILRKIEVHVGKKIDPSETLLFFDEIQACPNALKSLRYFFEEMPSVMILGAGSLLEFALDTTSFPVGSVDFAWMRPLCFKEFLVAMGNESAAEFIPTPQEYTVLPESVHTKIIDLLRIYCVVGGMPEAVARYLATGSFVDVANVHRALFESYLADLNKYRDRSDIEGVDRLIAKIPSTIGKQLKFTYLEPDWPIFKTKKVLHLLEKILLIQPVKSVLASGLPLGSQTSEKVFKLLFLDIGLMQHVAGLSVATTLNASNLVDTYRGAVAEQFVGQELLYAQGSENNKLYYWVRPQKSSQAEVDYIIVRQGEIVPVEVKSGSAGKLKSMSLFLAEHPMCKRGIVLSSENIFNDEKHRLLFLPLYASV